MTTWNLTTPRTLPGANRTAEGSNPLCGDQITVYLKCATLPWHTLHAALVGEGRDGLDGVGVT